MPIVSPAQIDAVANKVYNDLICGLGLDAARKALLIISRKLRAEKHRRDKLNDKRRKTK